LHRLVWVTRLTRDGIILKDDLVDDSTAWFPEPNTVLGSRGGQEVLDLCVDDLSQVLLVLNLCLDQMVAVDGGRHDVNDIVGGLRGGGEFRVLACADTGSETPLGVRQYLLFFSFLWITATWLSLSFLFQNLLRHMGQNASCSEVDMVRRTGAGLPGNLFNYV
jgi:hypothetical protein